MNPNKILVIITNENQISICKKASVPNFLFPLKDFAVGFETTFSLNEIEEGYLLINRILDTKAYQELKMLLKNLKDQIKGIVFEDFGIIKLAQELNLKQELILYQTHFGTNSKSINANLKFVDSQVISTDITREEINDILNAAIKPLVYVLYGLIPVMYSRRTLLTNFEETFKTDKETQVMLEEVVSKKRFQAIENEYGTILYHDKFLNGQIEAHTAKIKFCLLNTLGLSSEDFEKVLNDYLNQEKKLEAQEDQGFLETKTIYRLKEVRRAEN